MILGLGDFVRGQLEAVLSQLTCHCERTGVKRRGAWQSHDEIDCRVAFLFALVSPENEGVKAEALRVRLLAMTTTGDPQGRPYINRFGIFNCSISKFHYQLLLLVIEISG